MLEVMTHKILTKKEKYYICFINADMCELQAGANKLSFDIKNRDRKIGSCLSLIQNAFTFKEFIHDNHGSEGTHCYVYFK